jgi:hypothetical protein
MNDLHIQRLSVIIWTNQLLRGFEWGSRDRISWDRNRRSKLLVCKIDHEIEIIAKFHEIEINILQKRSGDRIGPRGPRELG